MNDLTGKKFGKLTCLEKTDERKDKKIVWLFQCQCGNKIKILGTSVVAGLTNSCGCLTRKHGYFGTKTYHSWRAARQRCLDMGHKDYPRYGGRGIKFCDRWKDFNNFLSDMGEKPEGLTLDRIDSNGNYSPENCRWASVKDQARNRRRSIIIDGKPLIEWCEIKKIKYHTAHKRYQKGWPLKEILK